MTEVCHTKGKQYMVEVIYKKLLCMLFAG